MVSNDDSIKDCAKHFVPQKVLSKGHVNPSLAGEVHACFLPSATVGSKIPCDIICMALCA